MATKFLGKPVKVKGDVHSFVERLRESKTCFMIPKPKNHDLIVRKLPPGKNWQEKMEDKFQYNKEPIVDESINSDLVGTKAEEDEPVNPNEV